MTRMLALACALVGILTAQTPNPPQFVDLMPDFRGIAPAYYERITMTPDGRRGWAGDGHSFLATAHEAQAPRIAKFEITPDFEVELAADDPDTHAEEIRGTIEVEGKGLELAADKVRRTFRLSEADAVEWPKAVFQKGEKLEKTLREQGFTVLPPMYDRDATRVRIEAAIRIAPAGPDDRLLVYFGGHGDDEKGFQEKPVGYLVPYDGRKSDLWGTAFPLEKIAGEYSSHLRAKHVLFALDSCQSGFAVSRGSPLEISAEELKRFKAIAEIETLSSEPGRTILTAGTGGQDALDVSGGIFTAALTDAIRGKADTDHNGVVDYFELFAYVWGRVNAEAWLWTRKQQPADY